MKYISQTMDFISYTNGKDGVGINSTTVTYGVSDSSLTQPTTWSPDLPTVSDGQYLWTRTITDYTDASVADTVTYTYAKQGEKGETGAPGASVVVSSIQYQAGDSATTAPTGTWSDTVVAAEEGQYLWTKTTFSDGSVAYGVAKQGSSGKDGSTGVSVTKVVTQYCVSADNTNAPTSGWTDDFDEALVTYYDNKKADSTKTYYIWSQERVEYSSGNTTYSVATVNNASAVVASWCYENDTTKINGANIATGSIIADAIDTTDLHVDAANITGALTVFNSNEQTLLYAGDNTVNLGDFSVERDDNRSYIYNGMTSYNDGDNPGVYLGTDGIGLGYGKFFVTNSGYIHSILGYIGGFNINDNALYTNGLDAFDGTSDGVYIGPDGIIYRSSTDDGVYGEFLIDSLGRFSATRSGGGATWETAKIRFDSDGFYSTNAIDEYSDGYRATGIQPYGIQTYYDGSGSLPILFNQDVDGTRFHLLYSGPWGSNASFTFFNGANVVTNGVNSALVIQSIEGIPPIHMYGGAIVFGYDNGQSVGTISSGYDGITLTGTWIIDSDMISTSWRGAKHDIEPLSDKYSVLFDNLKPVMYKYNNGTSGRYHTGFILDELKSAMDIAGIDSSEFAAYCVTDDETGAGGIRYGELIALCVKEIQNLKQRFSELEQKEK